VKRVVVVPVFVKVTVLIGPAFTLAALACLGFLNGELGGRGSRGGYPPPAIKPSPSSREGEGRRDQVCRPDVRWREDSI